jgi:hypothetical protein
MSTAPRRQGSVNQFLLSSKHYNSIFFSSELAQLEKWKVFKWVKDTWLNSQKQIGVGGPMWIEAVQGLPAFSRYNIPKRGKIYQMTTKCTKSQYNILPICPLSRKDGHKNTDILHCKTF